MNALPSGTVTFLFADVEASTALQRDAPTEYPSAIALLRQTLRERAVAYDGVEADAVGDEYVAAFAAPASGAEAALAMQRALRDTTWPGQVRVRVRIGLHTGTPWLGDEGYTGIDVVRASRIANAGHGGQILVSDETLAALDGVLSRDLGEFRLEGLASPERIHQLLADDLPRDFPPLRNTISMLGAGISVVLADDTVLLREGIARLLADAGFEVVAQSDNPDDLLRHVGMHKPGVAVVDIRMPPTHTDEGLRAAREIRERFPATSVLVLSQYVDPTFALRLLSHGERGVGYLRKDDVIASSGFAETIRRIGRGESVIDPTLVAGLLGRRVRDDPLDHLSAREREVLALIAEGRSNAGIADALTITEKTVEFHVSSIFSKLGLEGSAGEHRRVLAVLAFLRAEPGDPA